MADTFVTTICDFHYNYYACSNKETLAMLDIIFISIQVSNLICPFLYYVIRKIRKATSTPIDALALINVISRSLNVLYLFRLRQVLWLGPEDMLSYTRGNIFTEWIIMTISGVAMNTFVAIMIQTISGSPLYDPLIIHGKRVDPTLLLKLWRILFGAGVACCYITFGTIGVYSHDNFVVWRRAALFPVGAVSCIVSPVLLYIFGNNVIRVIISAPGGHKSESNPESSTGDGVKLETKTEKKLAVVSGVGPSRDSKPRKSTGKANTQRKVDSLQRAIYGPIAVFIVSGIVFFMAPIINDLFEGNPTAMFYGKVFLDGSTVFPGLFLSWYYAGKLYELIKS